MAKTFKEVSQDPVLYNLLKQSPYSTDAIDDGGIFYLEPFWVEDAEDIYAVVDFFHQFRAGPEPEEEAVPKTYDNQTTQDLTTLFPQGPLELYRQCPMLFTHGPFWIAGNTIYETLTHWDKHWLGK